VTLMDVIWMLARILIIFVVLLTAMAYTTYVERRFLAWFQWRMGPNRVGWLGLVQPIADGVKLLFKQELIPRMADRFLYLLAPALSFIAAFAIVSVIPVTRHFYIADVNIALLLVLALSALGTYGVILAGWSSGSKYPFLGSLRSCAQMISYELALALTCIGVVLLAGSFSLQAITTQQARMWYVIPQVVGFLVFMAAAVAETNRSPFDLPEAENELVGGYHTEYSSMKFALFFLAEYVAIINMSMLAAVLFFGGWQGPLLFGSGLAGLSGLFWFVLKTFVIIFAFIWLRATLPRFRYDQLMKFGWLVLFPLALLNVLVTAWIKVFV